MNSTDKFPVYLAKLGTAQNKGDAERLLAKLGTTRIKEMQKNLANGIKPSEPDTNNSAANITTPQAVHEPDIHERFTNGQDKTNEKTQDNSTYSVIPTGYVLKPRAILKHKISDAPPHVREVYDWFVLQADYRGQTIKSIKNIQDGLCWHVGFRKETYSKSKCAMALKWLRKHRMIETTKTKLGLIVTICSYDFYQNPENYESNNESLTKETDTGNYTERNMLKQKNALEAVS